MKRKYLTIKDIQINEGLKQIGITLPKKLSNFITTGGSEISKAEVYIRELSKFYKSKGILDEDLKDRVIKALRVDMRNLLNFKNGSGKSYAGLNKLSKKDALNLYDSLLKYIEKTKTVPAKHATFEVDVAKAVGGVVKHDSTSVTIKKDGKVIKQSEFIRLSIEKELNVSGITSYFKFDKIDVESFHQYEVKKYSTKYFIKNGVLYSEFMGFDKMSDRDKGGKGSPKQKFLNKIKDEIKLKIKEVTDEQVVSKINEVIIKFYNDNLKEMEKSLRDQFDNKGKSIVIGANTKEAMVYPLKGIKAKIILAGRGGVEITNPKSFNRILRIATIIKKTEDGTPLNKVGDLNKGRNEVMKFLSGKSTLSLPAPDQTTAESIEKYLGDFLSEVTNV